MPLQPSKHNIISPLDKGNSYLLVNMLSGHADVISEAEYMVLQNPPQEGYPPEFTDKGYVKDPQQEDLDYQLRYIQHLEDRDKEEIQLFFVPTYSCNFHCSYCYQSEYPVKHQNLDPRVTDAFFAFIEQQFAHRKKYITLFGGEPLLTGNQYIENLAYFIEQTYANQLDLAIVTNGYHLDRYTEFLKPAQTREIQITLDGTRDTHNQRRKLKDHTGTFDRIVDNIDRCLQKNISVNLRMVADRDNMDNLPDLAAFAIQKNWTQNPLFKTQIGRNYELHYCQNGKSKLFDRLSLYQELLGLIQKHPHIIQFHKPAFSVLKFLHENGTLPDPLFDACPACKSEWAMDFTGSIYSCTANVGKPGEKLGTFFPDIQLSHPKIKQWQQRDVRHIEKCRECNLQLICAGGCGSMAFNQNQSILSPDCRPVDQLISLGARAYFPDL